MGGDLRCTGLFQNPVVCMAGNVFFYFFHDTDAGCLGRAVLFLRTGVHSVTAFGGKHGVYPRDPAESLPNGEMEQPGMWECMVSDFCFCLWPSAWREQMAEPRKVCYSLHRFCLP